MADLKIIYKDITDIRPYPNNPRDNAPGVDAVAASIREFGFKVPIIIDRTGEIVAGHTRIMAAEKLGLKKVPCIIADDLTEAQIKAFRIADNQTASLTEWNEELLSVELGDLADMNFDLSITGFSDIELEEFFNVGRGGVTEDQPPDPPEEPTTKPGDLWLLGRHRLLCGDATIITDVERLMDGKKADMVFTDPPYNISYQGVKDKRGIINDKMSDDDFVGFLQQSIMVCDTVYVCCSWQYEHLFKQAMTNLGIPPKAMIIWNKVNPAQHLDKYFKQHEIIFYYGKFGGEKTLRGDIWECKRQRNTVHPTMKPIKLIAMALDDNPDKKIIYDGFGGSGSTLIACEQLGRSCYMMELDPKYCDVIVKRWENFTGKKAQLSE